MKSLFKKIVVAVLQWEAHAVIRKNKPTIIAITGSVGKTSTKDATYHILSSAGVFVRKSEKSFNSEIGVPLTILGLQNAWNSPSGWMQNMVLGLGQIYPILGSGNRAPYPACLVLEVGADHPGDIERLTRWLSPDIAVITAVSKIPVHVEFFPSPEAVLKEKLALVRGIRPEGKLVLPAYDPDILAVRKEAPQKGAADLSKVPCITFSVASSAGDVPAASADISASTPEIVYQNFKEGVIETARPVGMSFVLMYKNKKDVTEKSQVTIHGVIGIQHIHSIVIAAAAALSYGIGFSEIAAAIPKYQAPRGRMNLLDGIVGTVLIDDTYNSSPDALKAALDVLADVKASRKIAVLGDMMELGKFSTEEHRKAGERVAAAFAANPKNNLLITVGIRARDIAEGASARAVPPDSIKSFETSAEAAQWLRNFFHKEGLLRGDPGSVILIKGSQSSRMERVTFALLADQSRAGELLVRQDAEWLAKK